MVIFTSGAYCALIEMGNATRQEIAISPNTIFLINITDLTRDNIIN